ncbi:hypothetical protein [Cyanobium sp. Aljojuca 7D2]|uniref:hypothetical protein n=1 Tax=Cyanobium sp. Aljojuca 7D2 TaxID=2823698 RepID=UPI0020CEF6AC|nr:hypothetical protein [Cyanobium sp. Aljojuca 7D2]
MALTDPLAQAGRVNQIRRDGWILALGDIPGHNVAALSDDNRIEGGGCARTLYLSIVAYFD